MRHLTTFTVATLTTCLLVALLAFPIGFALQWVWNASVYRAFTFAREIDFKAAYGLAALYLALNIQGGIKRGANQ